MMPKPKKGRPPFSGRTGRRAFCARAITLCSCAFAACISAQQNENDTAVVLDQAAAAVAPSVEDSYHRIHQQPELGKKEFITSKLVRARLEQLGITQFVDVPSLPTAVVGLIDTGRPGKTVALRAELDARPGTEATGLPFASTIPDCMHSCGHDAHAAILLGAAEVIKKHLDLFSGRVVFLFQPAEETAGGADDVVRDKILSNLNVTTMVAQHSAPGLPVGKFQISPGAVLAGSSYFTVDVKGRGGHAATPHETDDVLTGATAMVTEIVRLPARSLDVLRHPCVISVTYLNSGETTALNVLPPSAQFRGTIRSFDALDDQIAGKESIRTLFMRTITGSAAERGLSATVDLHNGPPPTLNDSALYCSLVPLLAKRLGEEALSTGERGMFSEDFAYYTPVVPCLYFSLGIQKDGLGNESVHTNKFTIHPDALRYGVRLFVHAAQLLGR